MANFRRSFRWPSENKKTFTVAIPRSESGFGFTVAWTKPPLVDFVNEGGTASKSGLMPGDKIICIDKIKVSKKGKEEIENIVKNAKEIMELEIIRPEGELATRKRQTSLRRKESFTKKGSRMVIQDSSIMLWRRERALLKLLLCEEDFLTSICEGKERFLMPLRKRCTLATPAEIDILFSNIEEVGAVHERYVQHVRQLTQGIDDHIGKLYQKQVEGRCTVLRKYISGLPVAKILLKYKCLNKPFREFVQVTNNSEVKSDILKFIEKPLTYCSEMAKQLGTLLSCTAVGHRDYISLENAVKTFQTFGEEVNEMMDKLSCCEEFESTEPAFDAEDPYINLETLQEKTLFTKGPEDFSLIHPGRYWLFASPLSKVEGKHYVQYWALLLSDCLILARRTAQRVLLVLDEPIMLKSIYRATFDVKICDTEFRIIFSVEKSSGKRWITWILRTSSEGLKLLWHAVLTKQLSYYSAGSQASLPYSSRQTGIKTFLPNKKSIHKEPPLVTSTERSEITTCCIESEETSMLNDSNLDDIAANRENIADKQKHLREFTEGQTDFSMEMRTKACKERSYSSLNENELSYDNISVKRKTEFNRSKSFGNDISESIPFIDSLEENSSGTESNIVSIQEQKVFDGEKLESEINKEKGEKTGFPPAIKSAPEVTRTFDKFVQTENLAKSTEAKQSTPKKRFPRLGTFEKIKVDSRSSSQNEQNISVSRIRTGTSFRQKKQQRSTSQSNEPLVKSDSTPLYKAEEKDSCRSSNQPFPQKRSRNIFARFWRKELKVQLPKNEEMRMEATSDAEADNERLPDYKSAVNSPGTSDL